jgi:hypothetical protein
MSLLQKITYATKQASNEVPIVEPTVTDAWRAQDANEVKTKVNALVDKFNDNVGDFTVADFAAVFQGALAGTYTVAGLASNAYPDILR